MPAVTWWAPAGPLAACGQVFGLYLLFIIRPVVLVTVFGVTAFVVWLEMRPVPYLARHRRRTWWDDVVLRP